MKDPKARRWNEVSLNKLNARLVAWHEALPADMRWKNWTTNKDVLQPNSAILQHQHTLENTPLIFVGATIIAINTVLVTTRRQGNSLPIKRETLLPTLDVALEEMSVSWKLAAEARQKVRNALNFMQQQHPDPASETRKTSPSHSGAQSYDQPPLVDPAKVQASANPPFMTIEQENLEKVSQTSEFDIPEQSVWEPMSALDSEAAYWGNLGNDIFAGWSLDFVNDVTDFDWPDPPSIPK
ncbi:hypothetical protein ColLi_07731 [Colletotrichum liriopes]|uniref:Uncharacterized protein n=1 Tax=Colletotrichum liriopes TaxID=708192 RepID=A0AA37GRK6_9PEZI|nr:hypothetical protein ColLi_07731 [Colletotrichum liriopes]